MASLGHIELKRIITGCGINYVVHCIGFRKLSSLITTGYPLIPIIRYLSWQLTIQKSVYWHFISMNKLNLPHAMELLPSRKNKNHCISSNEDHLCWPFHLWCCQDISIYGLDLVCNIDLVYGIDLVCSIDLICSIDLVCLEYKMDYMIKADPSRKCGLITGW